jgi:hypothetical protein
MVILAKVTLSHGNQGQTLDFMLWHFHVTCKCWSSDIFPHTRLWTLSKRIQTENQQYQITYKFITAPQNLEDVHCHLYVSRSHFAENESYKISNVCKYVMHKLSVKCFPAKKRVTTLHNICIEMFSFSKICFTNRWGPHISGVLSW